MTIDRRHFAKSVTGVVGAAFAGASTRTSAQAPSAAPQTAGRLALAKVTRIRLFYPQNYDRNGPQAFPQSNMVVLVDTDAGITGVGQGGSPDTVRNVARSVIGRNAFDTEMIWQAAFMDGFYSPGKERLHALGAIDLALWDIKSKALGVPLYAMAGGYALSGRGPRWGRAMCGVLVLTAVPIWALTAESIAGPDFVVTNPRGFWVAVYYYSFLAVFSLAAAIPHRAANTARHAVQANDFEPGVAQVP